MPLPETIERFETELGELEPIVALSQRLLGQVIRPDPLPADVEKVRGSLRSARELEERHDTRAAEPLVTKAGESLHALRQWLAVTDLAISPFALRTYLEKNPAAPEVLRLLIRYLLIKQPHADNDRDKLDYLLSAYFVPSPSEGEARLAERGELYDAVAALFPEPLARESLSNAAEVMLHDLESLIALIEEFNDFDKLVQARMVERVRALKTNLHQEFYHPRTLATVVRFNHSFRRHFDRLFLQQLNTVRRDTRALLEGAWEQIRTIEEAYENLTHEEADTEAAVAAALAGAGEESKRVGRPLDVLDERPPIDRLVGRGQERQKEQELRGIVNRLTRFLESLTGAQAASDKVVFRLRRGEITLEPWQREAFTLSATNAAPESTRVVQQALGVMAWMEEELAHYTETRDDRYLWKAHLDVISYAVARAVELLGAIRGLLRADAAKAEAAWFDSLLQTALRLGTTLNRVTPLFDEPAAA